MTISRQNISIIIVTFKSEKVIHQCIKSIPKDLAIIIIDNSIDENFKEKIEKAYNNVRCILSPKNLGMGAGNNLGLKHIQTDYAFILNPDVILESNTIDEIIHASSHLDSFAIVAPISNNKNYPNYKLSKNQKINFDKDRPFRVMSVDGYAMVLNIKRLKNFEEFRDQNYFDENFFMYLENDDLCKNLVRLNQNIYIIPKSKINHLGGKATDVKYEYQIEMSRNWHWIWSKFYFNKKHYGYFAAIKDGFPTFISSVIKFLIYFFVNRKRRDIYLHRTLGFFNAIIGKSSNFRPKL